MPVLTNLDQFEQYDIETEICDAVGSTRDTAQKIVALVFVPELDKRLHAAVSRVLHAAAADVERMDRIQETPLDAVPAPDTTWYRAPAQAALRRVLGLKNNVRGESLAHWLRAYALRGDHR